MSRPKREEQGASVAALDITPTIDVVFLLLIFFIATIRLPEPEANIRAYLPRKEQASAAAQARVEEKETENINWIEIMLRGVGGRTQIRLNGAVLKGGFRRLDASLASLRRIAAQTPEVETKVMLDASREVPYRYVVRALDLCAKNTFSNVSFAMPRKGAAPAP